MTPAQQNAVNLADEVLKAAGLPTYTEIQHGLQVLDEYCELEAGEGPEDLDAARVDLQKAAYAFRDPDLGEVDHPEDVPRAPPQHVIEAALRRLMLQGPNSQAVQEMPASATRNVESTDEVVDSMTAAIKQMFPEISPARCAATARTLHADHGSIDLIDGDIVTIYIAPSPGLGYVAADQARIYAIPYMLRDGQSPRDLAAYQHQWAEIGLFVPSTQKVRCLESDFAHIAEELVGQAPGVMFVTVRADALARRMEGTSEQEGRGKAQRPV
jgi:hypothetical protein